MEMIIIGYQGIGKSTLGGDFGYIDLESSSFWIDGNRADDWYKIYGNIAEHLSMQGYKVFLSSHAVIRERLKDSEEKKVIVCPSLELKNEWIKRLMDRYEDTGKEKDYKAWKNAEDRYTENIGELLADERYGHIVIPEIPYNLHDIIHEWCYDNYGYF